MDVSREEEDEDEDAGALARVRRARHEVDETLDFLGLGSKRPTRASAMEADDDAGGRREKRARGASEVMDAMGRLSLAFEVEAREDGERRPNRRRAPSLRDGRRWIWEETPCERWTGRTRWRNRLLRTRREDGRWSSR